MRPRSTDGRTARTCSSRRTCRSGIPGRAGPSGTKPMPSSSQVFRISGSGHAFEQRVSVLHGGDWLARRARGESSLATSPTGRSAAPCPSAMSSFTVPATSSTGTFGSARCWYSRSMRVDPQALQRSFDRRADGSGRTGVLPAVRADRGPGRCAKPNFVAISTFPFRGSSASPTISSLRKGP